MIQCSPPSLLGDELTIAKGYFSISINSSISSSISSSIKRHLLSAFSGDLGLKKNKIDSTETITKKNLKKSYNLFIGT